MPAPLTQRLRPAPLAVKVVQAETEVMLHRQRVVARVSSIGQELRTQLTSPAMFLVAGSLGFAAGIFTRPRAARPDIETQPGAPPSSPLATLLSLLGVVRTLANILPANAPGGSVPSATGTTIKDFQEFIPNRRRPPGRSPLI